MIHFLQAADIAVFNTIVYSLKNGFFDVLMPLLSDANTWRLPLLGLWIGFIALGRKKGLKTAILCVIAVGITDYLCGGILQPLIHRPRPLGGVTPSFPSCHAANTFAAATVISYVWRKQWVYACVFALAGAVAYSRVYTTSHYPSDVVAGAVIGSGIALGASVLYERIAERIKRK